jgi:hypothetical protein
MMPKISVRVGPPGTRWRHRLRSVGQRVMEMARLSRGKGEEPQEKMPGKYRELVRRRRPVQN